MKRCCPSKKSKGRIYCLVAALSNLIHKQCEASATYKCKTKQHHRVSCFITINSSAHYTSWKTIQGNKLHKCVWFSTYSGAKMLKPPRRRLRERLLKNVYLPSGPKVSEFSKEGQIPTAAHNSRSVKKKKKTALPALRLVFYNVCQQLLSENCLLTYCTVGCFTGQNRCFLAQLGPCI